MEETEWQRYGAGRNPRCDNCMAHCGYEGTAVADAVAHPFKALTAALRGPRLTGSMAPDLPVLYAERPAMASVAIPVAAVKRAGERTASAAERR